jgi:hypothetical protein
MAKKPLYHHHPTVPTKKWYANFHLGVQLTDFCETTKMKGAAVAASGQYAKRVGPLWGVLPTESAKETCEKRLVTVIHPRFLQLALVRFAKRLENESVSCASKLAS